MEKLQIIRCENPFNRKDRVISSKPFDYGTTLLDIYCQEVPDAIEVSMSLNGKIVPDYQWDKTFLKKGDQVLIVPEVKDFGGDATLRNILMIAVTVAVIYYAPAFSGYVQSSWGLTAGSGAYSLAMAGYYASALMVGGILVNALVGTAPAASMGLSESDSQSSVYKWNPSTTQEQGSAIPYCYGLHKVYGNIISGFLESEGDINYTNVLIALGMGPVNKIYDFKINDQLVKEEVNDVSYDNFDGTTIEVRYGTVGQTVISNFNDTKIEFIPSAKIPRGSYANFTTVNSDFDGLEIEIRCPNGLYYIADDGSYVEYSVPIIVQCKKSSESGTDAWMTLTSESVTTTNVTDGNDYRWSLGKWTVCGGCGQAHLWTEYQVGSTVYADHKEGELYTTASGRWSAGHIVYDIWGDGGGSGWEEYKAGSTVFGDHYEGEPYSTPINGRWELGRWINDGESKWWEAIEIGPTTYNSHYEGESVGNYKWRWTGNVGDTWKWISDRPDLTYQWRWIIGKIYTTTTSTNVYPYTTIRGNSPKEIVKIFKLNGLNHEKYDIRAIRMSEDITNNRYSDDVYLSIVREVYNDDFEYPRIALVGIKSLATENVSGSLKFSCMLEGRRVWVYNSSTGIWTVGYSNNPAWVCYDILTQPVYYNNENVSRYDGYNPSYLDTASFSEWADWCDTLVADGAGGLEKRITFNGVFDNANESMWSAALRVCNTGRASLIWNGNVITVVVDKAGTETQLFTVGNVGIDSFKEMFFSSEDRAGEIEVQFTNAANDYEKDTYTYVSSDSGNVENKVSLSLIGCTKPSEAWRAAKYRALCNQYLLRSIEFDVDIDAIACSIGDIIRFQHDVPQWGYGGRVVSADTNSVTLDQTVTIAAGSSYEIIIRLSDDTVVEKTVTNTPGDYTVLTMSTPFSTLPAQYDVYAFGVVDVSYKPFRVTGMSRKSDLKMTINAVEYNSNVYSIDSGTPVVPTSNYSALVPYVKIQNLNVYYEIAIDSSDAINAKVIAVWSVDTNTIYKSAYVYIRERSVDGTYGNWFFKGETTTKRFEINGLKLGTTYQVGVIGVSFTGAVTPFSGIVLKTVTTDDVPAFYSTMLEKKITGLQLFNDPNGSSFTGKDCKIQWNSMSAVDVNTEAGGAAGDISPNVWLKDYQIKVYDSSGVLRRTEYVVDAWYTYTFDKNTEDGSGTPVASFSISVCARSRIGGISLTESKIYVSNPVPSAVTNLIAYSIVGGVQYAWDKNTEEDMQCYYVRTKVSTGLYNAWARITDNKYTRVLTAAEIALYGSNATVYIEVQVLDLFNQASSTETTNEKASTISDNLFQLVGSKSGGTGSVTDLYDGTRTSGGVTI